ncbi:MAG: AmmeMemoRadiSam system radical SAM enzyme [Anaerolineales bacterium]|nr:AmmeMemoRadiSam system radical SAM enzyme [Anaerolineales bacterium]
MSRLAHILDQLTRAGELYESLPDKALRCCACGHRCLIKEGRRGICQVRFNRDGQIRVPWGYVAALQADPIEKKPFFHLLPGSTALTFGMLGCDFHCNYCQNWLSSQAMRDPASDISIRYIREITPEQVIEAARQANASAMVSSYNEPLITSEWALAIFRLAKEAGMKCAYVSNGNLTPEVLAYLTPYLDAYKIDLKSMQDKNYRKLGGVLQNILDGIRLTHDAGLLVEVVTLVVPGFNDSNEELWETARFLTGISPDIPWHVTAFHKSYKMTDPDNTSPATLLRAAEIGREAGLRYVYAGNLPGRTGEYEDTFCPNCNRSLVQRTGYIIHSYQLGENGTCPNCGTGISGIWPGEPGQVHLEGPGRPFLV